MVALAEVRVSTQPTLATARLGKETLAPPQGLTLLAEAEVALEQLQQLWLVVQDYLTR
jgi:hypothetical protein